MAGHGATRLETWNHSSMPGDNDASNSLHLTPLLVSIGSRDAVPLLFSHTQHSRRVYLSHVCSICDPHATPGGIAPPSLRLLRITNSPLRSKFGLVLVVRRQRPHLPEAAAPGVWKYALSPNNRIASNDNKYRSGISSTTRYTIMVHPVRWCGYQWSERPRSLSTPLRQV